MDISKTAAEHEEKGRTPDGSACFGKLFSDHWLGKRLILVGSFVNGLTAHRKSQRGQPV